MSASKKIKDCPECMEEVQKYLSKCGDWEIKKKEVLEKVKDKICDSSQAKNKGHWAVVSQEVDKHLIKGWTGNNAGEAQHCPKCNVGWNWQTNGFGDFHWEGSYCEHSIPQNKEWLSQQGINIPKAGESIQASNQIKSNQIKSNQIKSNQISNSQTSESLENKKNYLPWILGGAGVVSLIGVVVYFLTKKKTLGLSEKTKGGEE